MLTRFGAIVWTLVVLSSSVCHADWPQFRGPDGQGHATADGLPLTWSEKENVRWKAAVPGLGWSSPTVEGDEIWLTTALDEGHSLRAICLALADGHILRDVEVFHPEKPPAIHSKNSYASPTPVLAGDRVIVHYGTCGTACLDRAGKILWKTDELKYDQGHGPGGSPVVWNDLVIVNCDGADTQYVVALDLTTGKIRWKRPRDHIGEPRRTGKDVVPIAFSTPLVIEADGRTQLLSAGADCLYSYDPATGEEIWWATYNGYSNVPRPVVGKGMVFVSSGYDKPTLYAVRLGGRGDVTATHVAWSMKKGAPLNPSPVLVGDELYVVSDGGIATCLDAVNGKIHWQQRLGGNFSASPLAAQGSIYFLDEEGTTTVLAAVTKFQRLASNKLEGRTLASLAVAGRAILLRTDTHLYRLESDAAAPDR